MSSKRKWDQQAHGEEDKETPTKVPRTEESKTASDAAAAAAAIAAKIAKITITASSSIIVNPF